ncbi:unnamed protein product [Choristocarpus tenellus]
MGATPPRVKIWGFNLAWVSLLLLGSFQCSMAFILNGRTLRSPTSHLTNGYLTSQGRKIERPRKGLRALEASLPKDLEGSERLERFLEDFEILGPMRFVSVKEGAILECVGSFENFRSSDQSKGRYLTVSNESGFECHINTDKVKSISMVTKPSKDEKYELYITRLYDAKGDVILAALIHGVDGVYEEGAVEYWKKLRDVFGAEQEL